MSGRPRELVFCHPCENEWYRDEHGLECPRCHSDFTEIVEQGNDPRNDFPPDLPHRPDAPGAYPDPDEDDISDMRWQPGRGTSYTYTAPGQQHNHQPGHGGQEGSLLPVVGSFASMLGSILGGRPLPGGSSPQQGQHAQAVDGGQTFGVDPYGRPRSAPGSPGFGGIPGMPGSTMGGPTTTAGRTTVRSGGGNGFQWSITTSSGPSFGAGPRDAHNPQPHNDPHQDLRPFLSMMFGQPPGQMQGMHGDHFHRHGDQFGPGGDPMAAMGPFGPLFAGILNPAMMRSGDGVYSQEALDRIISQLMEQNASGNAPGPAPAEAIASLPKREINEKDLGSEGKAECSICMDEVNIGQEVTELPCHHWFHGDCVKAWLGEHDTCPHCRQGIIPRDGPQESSRARNPHEAPRHDHSWGQGDGTRTNPFTVPESPDRPSTRRRHSSNAGPSRRSSHSNNNDGLFSRMRNAFGGGSS